MKEKLRRQILLLSVGKGRGKEGLGRLNVPDQFLDDGLFFTRRVLHGQTLWESRKKDKPFELEP